MNLVPSAINITPTVKPGILRSLRNNAIQEHITVAPMKDFKFHLQLPTLVSMLSHDSDEGLDLRGSILLRYYVLSILEYTLQYVLKNRIRKVFTHWPLHCSNSLEVTPQTPSSASSWISRVFMDCHMFGTSV